MTLIIGASPTPDIVAQFMGLKAAPIIPGPPVIPAADAIPGYVSYEGLESDYLIVQDDPAFHIAGDFTIIARIRKHPGAGPGTPGTYISRVGSFDGVDAIDFSYYLDITLGGIIFLWSTDGTEATMNAHLLDVDGDIYEFAWLATTFDVNNGAGGNSARLFVSDDGVNWTQEGATSTIAGVTSIYAGGSTPLRIGGVWDSGSTFQGDIQHMALYDGIGASGTVGGTEVFKMTGMEITSTGTAVPFESESGHLVEPNSEGAFLTYTAMTPAAAEIPSGAYTYGTKGGVQIVRFVDIYEQDGTTLWREKVPVTDGQISVDIGRDERRNVQLTIWDGDGLIGYGPHGGLWYDKVIKPYRGIVLDDGDTWVAPLGEFLIDTIDRPHFPNTIEINGRDFTKKLRQAVFTETTTFAAGLKVEDVIKTIALAGGITKFSLAVTGKTLASALTVERDTERFQPIKDLAESIAHEVFFDRFGNFVLRANVDPITAPTSINFGVGPTGNLASYNRQTSDSRLYNVVVVRGSGQTNGLVIGRAENNTAGSPTNIAEIGTRVMPPIENPIVADNAAALAIAQSFLRVAGLESYDVNMEALVAPWLECGDAVEFITTEDAANEPTRFLLTNFSIPMSLTTMSTTAKRVTIVV